MPDLCALWRGLLRCALVVMLAAVLTGCGDPCADLEQSICEDRPDPILCERYKAKLEEKRLSPKMCSALRSSYLELLESSSKK